MKDTFISPALGIGIVAVVAVVMALLLVSYINASAQVVLALTYPAPDSTPAPMVLEIDASGSVLIRGTVRTTGTNSITIDSWGGSWTIRTMSESTVFSQGQNDSGDMAAINEGDFVGAIGSMSSDTEFTLDATIVRDWTTNPLTESTLTPAPSPTGEPTASPTPTELSPTPTEMTPSPTMSPAGAGGPTTIY